MHWIPSHCTALLLVAGGKITFRSSLMHLNASVNVVGSCRTLWYSLCSLRSCCFKGAQMFHSKPISEVWGSECVSNPLTGRSASSRLRFRFGSCVRAGGRARRSCAGACGTLSSTLGLLGARMEVVAGGLRQLFAGRRAGFKGF